MNTLTHIHRNEHGQMMASKKILFFSPQQIVHLLHKTALHQCLHSVTLVGTGGYTDGHWPLVMLRDAQTCEGIRNQSMYNLNSFAGENGWHSTGHR